MPTTITATRAARDMIKHLQIRHGRIVFHLTGGCCDAGSPVCLPADELRIGARDVLVAEVEGIPFFEMSLDACRQDACCSDQVLDVTPGVGVGFSIEAVEGVRFTLREAGPVNSVVDRCTSQAAA